MSLYGSASFSVFLADGRDLLAAKLQGVTHKIENLLQKSDGLGDSWEASSPTGMRRATLTQDGAFFDDSTNSIHSTWSGGLSQTTSRIVCVGWAGNVIGRVFLGIQGAFGMAYEVLATVGSLTKANVTYTVNGIAEYGVILQEWATRTDDWNTAAEGHSVDNGASSANGGDGYLQVTGWNGSTALQVKIRHSTDNFSWSDLITFTNVTGREQAQRVNVTGTVNRYLSVITSGFGNVSASSSASASISPSSSLSPSASVSRSPSASLSPSASTSISPSSSRSPSASTSLSPSSSRSPSVSASSSASPSLSPSTSISPSSSVSPSAPAGSPSVTLFVGFARL